jgi:hypothetical protein
VHRVPRSADRFREYHDRALAPEPPMPFTFSEDARRKHRPAGLRVRGGDRRVPRCCPCSAARVPTPAPAAVHPSSGGSRRATSSGPVSKASPRTPRRRRLTEEGSGEISGWDFALALTLVVKEGPMSKLTPAVICLAILLTGCGGPLRADANAGPNPGGGFYGAPNINVGRINPWEASIPGGD